MPAWNRITKVGICQAIQRWQELESLTMPTIGHPPYIMEEIGRSCKNFTELKIMGSFDQHFASAIFQFLPKLKVLSTACCWLSPQTGGSKWFMSWMTKFSWEFHGCVNSTTARAGHTSHASGWWWMKASCAGTGMRIGFGVEMRSGPLICKIMGSYLMLAARGWRPWSRWLIRV